MITEYILNNNLAVLITRCRKSLLNANISIEASRLLRRFEGGVQN